MTVRHLFGGTALVAASTLLLASGAFAQAALAPGATVIPPQLTGLTTGYSFVSSESVAINQTNGTNTIAGSLVSAVYRNNTDSTLAFFYQVNSTTSNATITSFSVTSFFPAATSVAQTTDNIGAAGFTSGTIAAGSDFREFSGEGITFQGFNITAGTTSLAQFVKTDAKNYASNGSAAVLGSGVSQNLAAAVLAPNTPTVAPEPGSLALAATGMLSMLGMVSVRRRRAA